MAAKNKGRRRYKKCYKGREMVLGGGGGVAAATDFGMQDGIHLCKDEHYKSCTHTLFLSWASFASNATCIFWLSHLSAYFYVSNHL